MSEYEHIKVDIMESPGSPKMPSVIIKQENEESYFIESQQSLLGEFAKEDIDEYEDEDDPGFEAFNCNQDNFAQLSK